MTPAKPETEPRRIVSGALTIDVVPASERCVLRVAGELDMGTVAAFQTELDRLMSGEARDVIVDMERLEFIDSTGLQCLVQATRRSRMDGDRLRMAGARDEVERILELTGLDRVLPLSR